jgi:glutamate-1-semialdehyde 2,1-aminomutase
MYVGILEHSALPIGRVLRGIADEANRPVVFHCHGGKDRTGVIAAVLLAGLGVDREAILDDYEATRRYRTIEHQQDSLANMLAAGVSLPPSVFEAWFASGAHDDDVLSRIVEALPKAAKAAASAGRP